MKKPYILIAFIFLLHDFCFSHHGGHDPNGLKPTCWTFQDQTTVEGSLLMIKDFVVYIEGADHEAKSFHLSDFDLASQAYFVSKLNDIKVLNAHSSQMSDGEPEAKAGAMLMFSFPSTVTALMLLISIAFSLVFLRNRQYWRVSMFLSAGAGLLIIHACSGDGPSCDEKVWYEDKDGDGQGNPIVSINACEQPDGFVDNNLDTDDSGQVTVPANNPATMVSFFEMFTGVSTSSDSESFYVSSTGFPEHDKMVGITAWQQQVPAPQPYSGDNSWEIPIQPEYAAEPLSLVDGQHLLKGALAIAVNGVPIFNPLNNRGEDTKAIGELDNWGGHSGRADDYHYHVPPTHLEATVGNGNPIAWALDGFPVYGETSESLDENLGIQMQDGSYRYHTIPTYPYFMAAVVGVIAIDPNSTAPEDQITPQAMGSPIRTGDYGPLAGATITGWDKTTAGYKVSYTINEQLHSVEYSWDTSGKFKYVYTNPDGTFTEECYDAKRTINDKSGTEAITCGS